MLDRMVQWSCPPTGWRLLILPFTLAMIIPAVILSDVVLFTKGMLRKIILFPTEPGTREKDFVIVYLHKDIVEQDCIVCSNRFWTIGESRVCRKISCYIENRGRR